MFFKPKPKKWKPKQQGKVVAEIVGRPQDGSTQLNLRGRVAKAQIRSEAEEERQRIFKENQRLAKIQHGIK